MNKERGLLNKRQQKKIVKSSELFGSAKEIIILHNEHEYRLLITKAGKLILNK